MAHRSRFAAASLLAAAFSLAAVPAAAADLPAVPRGTTAEQVDVYDADLESAQGHRWRRHRGGIDAGDVLAGVLILGGIAAIASAASKEAREERYPPPFYPERQRYRTDDWGDRGAGLERAADMCIDEIERGRDRVGTVDNVSRTGAGWQVSGSLEGGAAFACRIDDQGRIRSIDLGSSADYFPAEDRQWSDDDYARARAARDRLEPGWTQETSPDWLDDRPEWNGSDSGVDGDLPAGDSRYDTARVRDFGPGI